MCTAHDDEDDFMYTYQIRYIKKKKTMKRVLKRQKAGNVGIE